MAGKPEITSFTSSWNKTLAWAKQNNIPFNVYYPVYQMDTQRLLSTGYGMSEGERINAIESAQGLNATTPTPQTSPWDLPVNAVHNAADIFTGLNPFGAGGGLLGNIFDTVKNTIEHPSTVYGMFEGPTPKDSTGRPIQGYWNQNIQNFIQHVDAPHTIWSLIPGFSDIAQVMQGHQGLKSLADNPLTSLLDILPMGKLIPKSLAESANGEAIASRLGTTREQLAKMDSIQLGYKLAKTLPLPGGKLVGPIYDAAGKAIGINRLKIGERINLFRNNKGMGADQAELLKGLIIKSEQGSERVFEKLAPIMEAIDNLSDEEKQMAYRAIQSDVRPIEDKIADSQYTTKVKDVLSAVHDYTMQDRTVKLATGKAVLIETQFGLELYTVKPGSNGAIVQRALLNSQRAQEILDQSSAKFDALAYRVLNMDRKAQTAFAVVGQLTAAVYGSIKRTIPELSDETTLNQLRHTLPQDQRWDRAVAQQTPLLRNLLGLAPEVSEAARRLFPDLPKGKNLTLHHVNAMRDLFSPGGLLDQMVKAYNDHDWIALSKYTRAVSRRFNSKVFENIPTDGRAVLYKVKKLSDEIHQYAVAREKDQNAMDKLMYGTRHGDLMANGKWAKTSIAALTKKAAEAHQQFIDAAIKHPPDTWSNVAMDKLVERIMNDERSASIVKEGIHYLSEHGFEQSTLDKLRKDPRTIVELFVRASKDSFGNGMMPDIDKGLMDSLRKDAMDEVASLRAQGHEPEYIPMISPFEAEKIANEGYAVYIGSLRPKSIASTFGRAFEFNSSVYNVALGLLKDAKDQVTQDVVQEFFNEYFTKHLHPTSELNQIASAYVQDELAHHVLQTMETGVRQKAVDTIVREQVSRMGLITYDPTSIFGEGFSVPKLNGDFYIDRNMADALQKGVQKFQFPAQNIYDRGTRIFRFSILGLSPRYTAHILFGGTALLAYRGHLSMVNQLRAGLHVFRTGQLPSDVLDRYPQAAEHMTKSATQEGDADRVFHSAAMYTMGNKVIQEWMDNHGKTSTALEWVKAAANINYRFTRAVVRAQRAVVYLDGAARAEKQGFFTELVPRKRLDANGHEVLHHITGNPIYDEVPVKRRMSPEQAHHEGMQAVSEVMGELRHMTPLERSVFLRAFPFYGWTKHILTYVFTYPIDHPYRANFLAQLATQNSQDVASGLPTRIQLLTFLGQPDQYGNVSAIDTRVFNPLRDTANYASWTGLFQSLNPVFSAAIAQVDPQITFGGNELYPNITYSQLYGTKEAGPQGNVFTAAEQFVPQLTALDEAFNLSGQYAYLKSQGSNAFAKKVFESLNVPFFQKQNINLRQIAAQNEIDRFQQAKADALQAAQTGDNSSLAGYAPNALLPDPLNSLYDVTPAYIEAMNQESESKYGYPMYQTTPPPPNPPL